MGRVGVLPFDPDSDGVRRADWWLLRDSAVHQIESPDLLDDTIRVLRDLGYSVRDLDAAAWTPTTLHDDLAVAFDFPDWYGRNLDALNDLLRDVALRDLGVDPAATGTVLVLRGFASFSGRHPREGQILLDLWASQSRTALVVGHPMILLLGAPESVWFDKIGGSPVLHFRGLPTIE